LVSLLALSAKTLDLGEATDLFLNGEAMEVVLKGDETLKCLVGDAS